MKYIGEFYSIDSRPYRIEIETQTPGADRTVKLSGNPFVASVKGDDKIIYSPIRCGGATVGLLSESYIFDLYAGQAKSVKVSLIETTNHGDTVRWTGYVSPTIYDQGYDDNLEDITLDCVDGVAVLKDIPFRSEERKITTLAEIIFQCLRESGCFKAFYISDNVQLSLSASDPVIEAFRISTSNFFDQRKDVKQTDDDLAWSCYDVLWHILQWLGYTLTVHGDIVYILDYDSITQGLNSYHRYSLETSSLGSPTYVKVSASKTIEGKDYAVNGTKLSLDEVYNKVTVKDEFNTYDNLFPTFGDENFETNITAPQQDLSSLFGALPTPTGDNVEAVRRSIWFADHIEADPSVGVYENTVIVLDMDWIGNIFLNFFQFKDSDIFDMKKYTRQANPVDCTADPNLHANFSYKDLFSINGAVYCKYLKVPPPQDIDLFDQYAIVYWVMLARTGGYDFNASTADKMKAWNSVFSAFNIRYTSLRLSPMILMLNTSDSRIGPSDGVNFNNVTDDEIIKDYPFVTLNQSFTSSVFGGADHFIHIKGKFRVHDEDATPHPLAGGYGDDDLAKHGDYKDTDQGFIWCLVKWGDRWWTGTKWDEDECWFKLDLWDRKDCSLNGMRVTDYFDREFEIQPNSLARIYTDGVGYAIPCPEEGNLQGTPMIAFAPRDFHGRSKHDQWNPPNEKMNNRYGRYFNKCCFLTDLSITAEVSSGLLSDADLDSDTCYTNVIENGSVSAMPEISFKVCTDDGKKPSYSSVDYLDGAESCFVAATYNKALHAREAGTTGADGLDAVLRQEEHYVFKTASHYENPKVVFECNLHNEDFLPYTLFSDPSLGSRKFVMTEWETDYRFNSVNLKISEKE